MEIFACHVCVCVVLVNIFVICMSCGDGYFLDESRKCVPCPEHCLFCDSSTRCLSCENGYWGTVCEITCSTCQNGTSCEKTNGFCLEACRDGRSGILCNASCDIKCFSCNRTNIHNCVKCASGRYQPVSCDSVCSTCHNTTCDDNGRCTFGCVKGYWGKTCNRSCPDHCLNEFCDWNNGTCINGCKGNYAGSKCDQEEKQNTSVLDRAVVIPLVIIILAVTVVVIIIYRKRKELFCRRSGNYRSDDPKAPEATEMIEKNMAEEETTDDHKIEKVEAVTTTEPSTTKPSRSKSKSKIFIIFACCANKQGEEYHRKNSDQGNKTDLRKQNESKSGRQDKLYELAQSIKRKTDKDYQVEWEKIPEKCSTLCYECNDEKNRLELEELGIGPYEHNKVCVKGKSRSYYFNASYIVEKGRPKPTYIACIGPNEHKKGFEIFWRMIWQEKCQAIVMLNTAKKTEELYWPTRDNNQLYGQIDVRCTEEQANKDYTRRRFEVKEDSECRHLTQFQYTTWPEGQGAVNIENLLEFFQTVNTETSKSSGPIVVHGRAGIGRTGTFIALDMLWKAAEEMLDGVDSVDETRIDIRACVEYLRTQRVRMVETVEQYIFLHEAFAQVIFSMMKERAYQMKDYTPDEQAAAEIPWY